MSDINTLAASNSLTDLAARIKTWHTAVAAALKDSVRHGIAAGELLLEAKAQLKHGEWLPWLRDHVEISERTAQLYMRLAKNRAEIESATAVADLTLNEATAMLVLSSDIKPLLDFVGRADGMSPEELVEYCAANDVARITKNPFGAKEPSEMTDAEWLEWEIYAIFLVRNGSGVDEALYYADRLQSRGWRVTMGCRDDEQWYGAYGDAYRTRNSLGTMPQASKDAWFAFYESHRSQTRASVQAEMAALEEQERNAPPCKPRRRRRMAS
jgi:hypothetical protein